MANVYVRSGAGGAGTGADWANAYTTLAAAFAAKAAGDDFWVSEDHAETQASGITLTCPGTITNPCRAICVNHLGTVPPVSADLRTTATITATAANFILISNYCYVYGIAFVSSANLIIGYNSASGLILENCKLTLTGASGTYLFLADDQTANTITCKSCTFKFASTDHAIRPRDGLITIQGGSIDGAGSTPDFLVAASSPAGSLILDGVDFSARPMSAIISTVAGRHGRMVVTNCKFNASTISSSTPGTDAEYDFINNGSGATNYITERYSYRGKQETETTVIRTGGATDGTTPVAWKITTTANSTRVMPYRSIPLTIWNDTTGSTVTVTIYGVWGGGAVPTSADIFPVVTYQGSSASPLATIVSGAPVDVLTAGANWTADGSTWGGSTTAFKMVTTLSTPQPAMKGPIYVTICAAKASDTFYIDPKIVLT